MFCTALLFLYLYFSCFVEIFPLRSVAPQLRFVAILLSTNAAALLVPPICFLIVQYSQRILILVLPFGRTSLLDDSNYSKRCFVPSAKCPFAILAAAILIKSFRIFVRSFGSISAGFGAP